MGFLVKLQSEIFILRVDRKRKFRIVLLANLSRSSVRGSTCLHGLVHTPVVFVPFLALISYIPMCPGKGNGMPCKAAVGQEGVV